MSSSSLSQFSSIVVNPESPKFYGPIHEVWEIIHQKILSYDYTKILDVGPGSMPFPYATHSIDFCSSSSLPNFEICNIEFDKFPFPDKFFDFVYCRHVLEDLNNPFHCISEMQRVSKNGYIETPNPLTEISRYPSSTEEQKSDIMLRGYIHHRWFVWVSEDNVLSFFPKYSYIENKNCFLLSQKLEHSIETQLKNDLMSWNTYYFWTNEITWKCYQNGKDYVMIKNINDKLFDVFNNIYFKMINEGQQNKNNMYQQIQKLFQK